VVAQGQNFTLEASDDLVQWLALLTDTFTTNTYDFVDEDAMGSGGTVLPRDRRSLIHRKDFIASPGPGKPTCPQTAGKAVCLRALVRPSKDISDVFVRGKISSGVFGFSLNSPSIPVSPRANHLPSARIAEPRPYVEELCAPCCSLIRDPT